MFLNVASTFKSKADILTWNVFPRLKHAFQKHFQEKNYNSIQEKNLLLSQSYKNFQLHSCGYFCNHIYNNNNDYACIVQNSCMW